AAHVRERREALRDRGAAPARAAGVVPGRRGAGAVGRGGGRPARARSDQVRPGQARPAPPHAGAPALLMTVVDVDTHIYEPTDIWEKYLERDYRVVARSAFWHETDAQGLETTLLNGHRARSLRRSGINRQACWRPGMTPEQIGQLDPDKRHPITPGAQDPTARLRDMDTMGVERALLFPTLFAEHFPLVENPDAA